LFTAIYNYCTFLLTVFLLNVWKPLVVDGIYPGCPFPSLVFRAGADHSQTPQPGAHRGKGALSWCKGGPERALLVVKGRIKGPKQMKTTVVVQEGDN